MNARMVSSETPTVGAAQVGMFAAARLSFRTFCRPGTLPDISRTRWRCRIDRRVDRQRIAGQLRAAAENGPVGMTKAEPFYPIEAARQDKNKQLARSLLTDLISDQLH